MIRKGKLLFVFAVVVLLLFILMASPAMAARVVLSVPGYAQPAGSNWCWAAIDKSIIQYLRGSSPTQQDIVNRFADGPNGSATMDAANNALHYYRVGTSMQYNKLTYTGVQWQINNNHPMFIRLQNGILGHANCMRGYDTSTSYVLFIDPYDGGYHGQSYSNYASGIHWDGNYWNWTGTIFDTYRT